MKKIINKLYKSRLFGRVFHTSVFCLERELSDCDSVLDLGCGPSSPLKYCHNIGHSVGVEAFPPYLEKSKREGIHAEYLESRIEKINYPPKSFDAVIMIEVLEHLPESTGCEILEKAEIWARNKVIISTPNGFYPQEAADNNSFQKHLSGWDIERMQGMGFRCRGLAGFKILRQEKKDERIKGEVIDSIAFWPKFFWYAIAALSQLIAYPYPKLAFGLFCVKRLPRSKTKSDE